MSKWEQLLEKTDGGLDIIGQIIPGAVKAAADAKYKKNIKVYLPNEKREHKSPSGSISRLSSGIYLVKCWNGWLSHPDRQGGAMDAVTLYQADKRLRTRREALDALYAMYGIQGEVLAEAPAPDIDLRPLAEGEQKGLENIVLRPFRESDLLSIFPRLSFGRMAGQAADKDADIARLSDVAERMGCSCIDYYETERGGIVERYASTDRYPILVFNYPKKKRYEPYAPPKEKMRYFLSGEIDKDFIAGIGYAKEMYEAYKLEQERDRPDMEGKSMKYRGLPELMIASGEKDGLCLSALGYPVVWFNSESAEISHKQFRSLTAIAERVVNVPDIDDTGTKQAHIRALAYPEMYTLWLPDGLRLYRDRRGKPCKDFADWAKNMYDRSQLQGMVKTARRALFYDHFYEEKTKKDGSIEIKERYKLNGDNLKQFYASSGIARYKAGTEETSPYQPVKIDGYKVSNFSEAAGFEFVKAYLEKKHESPKLKNYIGDLKPEKFGHFVDIELDFCTHTPSSQLLYFDNCIFECTAQGVKQHNKQLPGKHAWRESVAPHRVKRTAPAFEVCQAPDGMAEIKIHDTKSQFFRFLINSSRLHWQAEEQAFVDAETGYLDEARANEYFKLNRFNLFGAGLTAKQHDDHLRSLLNKMFAVGYLCHRHKDRSKPWIVTAMDNFVDEAGQSNGGAGKSMFFEWIGQAAHMLKKSAGKKDLLDNQFMFAGVTEKHAFVLLDDVHRRFDWEGMKDKATLGIEVEKKGVDADTLEYEKAPKWAVTTNFGIPDISASLKRRLLLVAFSDYYHAAVARYPRGEHKPEHDFGQGKQLPYDNSPEEWEADFNFIADCISFYLSVPFGMIEPPLENIERRNAQSAIPSWFQVWAEGYLDQYLNRYIYKDSAIASLRSKYPNRDVTAHRFTQFVKAWAAYHEYAINPPELRGAKKGLAIKPDGRMQINNRDCFFIVAAPITKEQIDSLPVDGTF